MDDVTSAVRDLGALVAAGFAATHVWPIDMFPHTPHIELVSLLERRAVGTPRE